MIQLDRFGLYGRPQGRPFHWKGASMAEEKKEKVNIVLEVQDGHISAESLFGYIDRNLKINLEKEKDNGSD
jgi:hypothetical protein